jgi:tetratricopeptide (TPR) repeat protein
LFTKGVAAAPQNAKLWLELAAAQAELKNWAAAAEAARKGVAAAPQNAKLWLELAAAQAELKNWAAAAEAAREAVRLGSDNAAEARLKLARMSLMAGKPADALAVLEGDPRIDGPKASALMAATLECMGQWEAAAEKQSQVLESSGEKEPLLSAWGYLEPTTANAIRIEQRCRELLRKHMAVQLVADLLIAFAIQDKGELIRQWADPESQIVELNLVDIQTLPATELCRLQAEIMALPDLNWFDTFRSSVGAWRTDLSEHNTGPVLRELLRALETTIGPLSTQIRLPPMHPWSRSGTADFRVGAWIVLTCSDGYHMPHLHHGSWLSGSFYVTRPAELRADAGLMVFGPPAELPKSLHPLWPVRRVDPTPGKLVLFPSYMSHATNPTNAEEPRICIAFNTKLPRPPS